MPVEDAVEQHLPRFGAASGLKDTLVEEAQRRIPEVTAWITWAEIREIVLRQREVFSNQDDDVVATVQRLCDSVTTAIDWHS